MKKRIEKRNAGRKSETFQMSEKDWKAVRNGAPDQGRKPLIVTLKLTPLQERALRCLCRRFSASPEELVMAALAVDLDGYNNSNEVEFCESRLSMLVDQFPDNQRLLEAYRRQFEEDDGRGVV